MFWIVLGVFLSLLLFITVVLMCFNMEFLNKIIERLSKRKIPVIPILVISLVLTFVCSFMVGKWWKEEYWVSVETIVINSQVELKKNTNFEDIDYGKKERVYRTTYKFIYDGEEYQFTSGLKNFKPVGTVETIKINPDKPLDFDCLGGIIPLLFIPFSFVIIVFRCLIGMFKKMFIK